MKKLLTILIAGVLLLSAAGCQNNIPAQPGESGTGAASSEKETSEENTTEEAAPDTGMKAGLGVITKLESSADAGEKDGLAQIDSTIAAVLLDGEGKIISCRIDEVQSKVNFDASGKITSDTSAPVQSKALLGEAYGMKKASGIGREWNEQASAFADYVTGKTAEEIQGIAVNEKGAPAGDDLSASVTISIGGFQRAIEKAAANAAPVAAKAGDTLGLGNKTALQSSADAGEEDGFAQADTTISVVVTDENGVISGCLIDAAQTKINFDASGKITSDLSAPKTKQELGDEYGMKKASSIGREWYEQANSFAEYAVGKTADALSGIAVNEKGAPDGDDLAASVTIGIGDFTEVIRAAVENSR